MVKDINGSGSSDPNDFSVFNNKLFFKANDGINGFELWVTDGTEDGTMIVTDIGAVSSGLDPKDLTVCNGKLYFRGEGPGWGDTLWVVEERTDGSTMEMYAIPNDGWFDPIILTEYNNRLFFKARYLNHYILWATDGTEEPGL